jgi:hypothetical protein
MLEAIGGTEVIGLVGVFVVFAGVHLLWQSRHEIAFWFEAFLRTFQVALRQDDGNPLAVLPAVAVPRERRTLRMVVGAGFLFFLGPFLIILGLVL